MTFDDPRDACRYQLAIYHSAARRMQATHLEPVEFHDDGTKIIVGQMLTRDGRLDLLAALEQYFDDVRTMLDEMQMMSRPERHHLIGLACDDSGCTPEERSS